VKEAELGFVRRQVKVEQRDLASLNRRATQEMRELEGYETMDSKEGRNREAIMAEEEGLECPGLKASAWQLDGM
jgi:hypothetical protein